MKIEQLFHHENPGWKDAKSALAGMPVSFVLVFGPRESICRASLLADLSARYPGGHLLFASTAGEVTEQGPFEGKVSVTAVALERTSVACAAVSVRSQFESHQAGAELGRRLRAPDLVHVFVLSDGQVVNGTELARGLNEQLPPGASLTGGLAGDGVHFDRTAVGLDEVPASGRIAALAFYGRHLQVGFGSCGGWNATGESHVVTRASGNILFQLDGQPALAIYKNHLGREAAGLPASALRFPFCVRSSEAETSVVRTILSVEDVTQSMVFAGDMPAGSRVRFMQAANADLLDGATRAATQARLEAPAELAVCVSCVGRRIVLGDNAPREVECVREVLGPSPVLTGFYSYGELAPEGPNAACQLHNQTMTITTFREI